MRGATGGTTCLEEEAYWLGVSVGVETGCACPEAGSMGGYGCHICVWWQVWLLVVVC